MKVWPVCTILAAAALLLGTARPGFTGRSASGAHGEHGAGHSRGAWGAGPHGNAGVPPRSTWHSGVRGPEAGPHPPFVHDHFRGHPEGRTIQAERVEILGDRVRIEKPVETIELPRSAVLSIHPVSPPTASPPGPPPADVYRGLTQRMTDKARREIQNRPLAPVYRGR
jgi:hypothetical protein